MPEPETTYRRNQKIEPRFLHAEGCDHADRCGCFPQPGKAEKAVTRQVTNPFLSPVPLSQAEFAYQRMKTAAEGIIKMNFGSWWAAINETGTTVFAVSRDDCEKIHQGLGECKDSKHGRQLGLLIERCPPGSTEILMTAEEIADTLAVHEHAGVRQAETATSKET